MEEYLIGKLASEMSEVEPPFTVAQDTDGLILAMAEHKVTEEKCEVWDQVTLSERTWYAVRYVNSGVIKVETDDSIHFIDRP